MSSPLWVTLIYDYVGLAGRSTHRRLVDLPLLLPRALIQALSHHRQRNFSRGLHSTNPKLIQLQKSTSLGHAIKTSPTNYVDDVEVVDLGVFVLDPCSLPQNASGLSNCAPQLSVVLLPA